MVSLLIADDNIEFAYNLSCMLAKEKNLKVLNICENGLQTLIACSSLKPDILILDLDMPGINGLDVLKNLNNDENKPDIIVLSGNANYRASITYASSIKYIFSKPVDNEFLIEKIRELQKELKRNCFIDNNLDNEIYKLLSKLKFNMHSKGTYLLIDSIKLAYQQPEYIIQSELLMKKVAQLHNFHNFKSVRSSIDKTINTMFTHHNNLDLLCNVFTDFYGDKPTPKSFISNSVHYLNKIN